MKSYVKAAIAAAAMAGLVVPNLPANAATFGAPVVVSSADNSEPGVEVAPDGTLYVHAPTGIPLWSSIYRSTNGGATWGQLTSITRASVGGGDIDMAIQPNGKLLFTDLWLGSSTVGVSSDKGNTWIQNPIEGVLAQDRQWVQTTGDDIAYHLTHQLAAGLMVSKSFDGGLTYVQHTIAATTLDQGNCICPPGYLIAEKGTATTVDGVKRLGTDDKVGVIYSTSTGVKFSRSLNGGLTFSHAIVDPTGGASTLDSFPIVANAGGDNLVAVWLENASSSSRVMISRSADWGKTWGPSSVLVSAGSSVFPWVDAKGSKVAVTLYHTTATGGPDKVANASQWFIKYLESSNGGASFGPLETADPTAVKSGPICTDGLNCNADRELGDFQMVAIDNAGMANISYVRSIDGNFNTEVRFVKQTS